MQRRNKLRTLRLVPNDRESVAKSAPQLDPSVPQRTIVALRDDGRIFTGAQAVFVTVSKTGGVLGAVCRVMSWRPLSLATEPFYRVFARYRSKLARFFSSGQEQENEHVNEQ